MNILFCINDLSFTVRAFACLNEMISSHYYFTIEALTQTEYEIKNLVGKTGYLQFGSNYRHGIIASAQDYGKRREGYFYSLILASPLHPLLLNQQSKVFVRKYLTEILQTIFPDLNFNIKQDIFIPYLVQHKEIDYDFFIALLKTYQWSYIYQHDENNSKIMIIDDLSIPTPSTPIENLTHTPVININNLYYKIINLKTNNPALQIGNLVNFNNMNYRILEITHNKKYRLKYVASLKLISPTLKYFNESPNKPIKYQAPHLTATTYGELTQEGQYFSRLYFSVNNTSQPQYLIEPHDGMHLPVPNNTQMALSHISGNISNPILLGIINDNPPVIAENNSQHIYQTLSFNQLLIEDEANKCRIQLKNTQNIFLLDASSNHINSLLKTAVQSIYFKAKNILFKSQGSHTQYTQNYRATIKNNQTILANNIKINSGKNFMSSAKNNLYLTAKIIQLDTSKLINITTKNNLNFKASLTFKTTQNNILIHAQKNIKFNSRGNINLQAGSTISINGGNLSFNAQQLKVNAPSISCPQPPPGA